MTDLTAQLADQVRAATADRAPLRIEGGGTRAWFGRPVEGQALKVAGHRGVIDYDPSELVITARAGTPMAEVEALLADNDQMLCFEPPSFGLAGTLGGAVATGLSGPRRPFTGALRDYVLGVRVMDGQGEALRFGGTVFKNVAGFDAFRLMAGAQGSLGVLLDVSLRVFPRPRVERALVFDMARDAGRNWVVEQMRRPLPLSGAFHDGQRLHIRLSGGEAAVTGAAREFGGEDEALDLWTTVRDLTHPAFQGAPVLWRIALPQTAPLPEFDGQLAWDWAGGVAWLKADEIAPQVWDWARRMDGHATLYRGAKAQVFQPLAPPILKLHQRIKAALDPAGVFNPGRMYEGL
ncbi:glycolate oxidase subunit GlcE [Phenylobacterium aquaticum]|uniref:glycolate oxidase subunit GlcE n=2 Tax=Phenylobacterium aquaticum TaxID=1763816 RepID=UPI0026EB6971|nr:glycolate oxidase subunit GlcE [Phenylobacterium aquaticum]